MVEYIVTLFDTDRTMFWLIAIMAAIGTFALRENVENKVIVLLFPPVLMATTLASNLFFQKLGFSASFGAVRLAAASSPSVLNQIAWTTIATATGLIIGGLLIVAFSRLASSRR